MKGLIIYVTFLVVGLIVAVLLGFYVERQTSSGVSLLAFLIMFFANYVIAWLATLLVMDGSIRRSPTRTDVRSGEGERGAVGIAHGARG